MTYDFAPMEGITTFVYRNTFEKYYGGIDRYYTPFLSSMHLSSREKNEVLPEHNTGIHLIPQILTNRSEDFLSIAAALRDYGYDTVNLNLGCPSGTVVSKHRGSGFLAVPETLDRFLDEIFSACPIKISIKTRIGISDEAEWAGILDIYEKYPIDELIVHTRLQQDFYKRPCHPNAFPEAHRLNIPLCYNGDITSREALAQVRLLDPSISRVMIGRGLIANPELLEELTGTPARDKERLAAFLSDLRDGYIREMSGSDRNTLYKMKEIWVYLGSLFQDADRHMKRIKKANRLSEYNSAVNSLFSECPLREKPFTNHSN
jgi:tRNA-dihydrouridine synthase